MKQFGTIEKPKSIYWGVSRKEKLMPWHHHFLTLSLLNPNVMPGVSAAIL